jgi:hypothetical protein
VAVALGMAPAWSRFGAAVGGPCHHGPLQVLLPGILLLLLYALLLLLPLLSDATGLASLLVTGSAALYLCLGLLLLLLLLYRPIDLL